MSATELYNARSQGAVLDEAHIGDIRGALGTIRHGDTAPRNGWWAMLIRIVCLATSGR